MGLWQRLTGGRRSEGEPVAGPSAGSGRPATGAAPATSTEARPAPGSGRAWASLSPLQRAVEPPALLTDSARFASRLTTRRNPEFLAPLGHAVGDPGPSGIVTGLLEPAGLPVSRPSPGLPPVAARTVPVSDRPVSPPTVARSAGLVSAARMAEPRAMPVVPRPEVERLPASVPSTSGSPNDVVGPLRESGPATAAPGVGSGPEPEPPASAPEPAPPTGAQESGPSAADLVKSAASATPGGEHAWAVSEAAGSRQADPGLATWAQAEPAEVSGGPAGPASNAGAAPLPPRPALDSPADAGPGDSPLRPDAPSPDAPTLGARELGLPTAGDATPSTPLQRTPDGSRAPVQRTRLDPQAGARSPAAPVPRVRQGLGEPLGTLPPTAMPAAQRSVGAEQLLRALNQADRPGPAPDATAAPASRSGPGAGRTGSWAPPAVQRSEPSAPAVAGLPGPVSSGASGRPGGGRPDRPTGERVLGIGPQDAGTGAPEGVPQAAADPDAGLIEAPEPAGPPAEQAVWTGAGAGTDGAAAGAPVAGVEPAAATGPDHWPPDPLLRLAGMPTVQLTGWRGLGSSLAGDLPGGAPGHGWGGGPAERGAPRLDASPAAAWQPGRGPTVSRTPAGLPQLPVVSGVLAPGRAPTGGGVVGAGTGGAEPSRATGTSALGRSTTGARGTALPGAPAARSSGPGAPPLAAQRLVGPPSGARPSPSPGPEAGSPPAPVVVGVGSPGAGPIRSEDLGIGPGAAGTPPEAWQATAAGRPWRPESSGQVQRSATEVAAAPSGDAADAGGGPTAVDLPDVDAALAGFGLPELGGVNGAEPGSAGPRAFASRAVPVPASAPGTPSPPTVARSVVGPAPWGAATRAGSGGPVVRGPGSPAGDLVLSRSASGWSSAPPSVGAGGSRSAAAGLTPRAGAGAVAVSLGVASFAADGSVVFASPTAEPHGESPTVQTIPAQPAIPPPPATVARVAASAPESAPTGPAVAGPAAAGGTGDLEALAVRLYPRLSRMLRLELTRERDRLGSLSDFRH